MTTYRERYIDAGLPFYPGGGINEYQIQKHFKGGVASMKDSTWVRDGYYRNGSIKGHHSCCGSKRAWRHKTNCQHLALLDSDDLSDLKDI